MFSKNRRINPHNKIGFTRQQRGFTLIELLVVIAILGILATLVIIATGESRARGRDGRRMADVKVMHDALELYVEDNIIAPEVTAVITWDDFVTNNLSSYIRGSAVPLDPLEADGFHYAICTSGGDAMDYPKSNFIVAAVMEVDYTTKTITGDLDNAHGYLATVVDGGCILSDDTILTTATVDAQLNCSDDGDATPVGIVGTRNGSVVCMGYYRTD